MDSHDASSQRPLPAALRIGLDAAAALCAALSLPRICLALALSSGLWLALAGHGGVGPATADGTHAASDRDGDGVHDAEDRCVDRAGLVPDGCPPRDGDGDGWLDSADHCPEQPGPAAMRGCPDTDGDGDGTVDRVDRCPDEPGNRYFAGCPAPDSDGDGIVDPDDRCADRPETWNGRRDTDGCPDRGEALIQVAPGRVTLARGRIFRGSGELASRGRESVRVAAGALAVMGVQRVRMVAASRGSEADQAARLARVARLLARLGPHIDIAVGPSIGPDEPPRIELLVP